MRYLSFLLILSLLFGCRNDKSITLQEGVWRAELQVTETEVLPFNFEVTSPDALKIFNANEVIDQPMN